MASDLKEQLKAASELAQQGQHEAARALLERIVAIDPDQELAWLWLAVVSTDRDERLQFLERTLALNPDNERALNAYAKLAGRPYSGGSAEPSLGAALAAAAPAPQRAAEPPPARPAPALAEPPADDLPRRTGAPPVDWTETIETRRSPVVTALLVVVTIAVVALGAFYFSRELVGDGNDQPDLPTIGPGGQVVPGSGTTDANTSGEPAVVVTRAPSSTPRPTRTAGPSPTFPPTWTPLASATLPPSRTPLPTFTPYPTLTATSDEPIPTTTPVPMETGEAGPPTSTSVFTATPTIAPTATDTPSPTDTLTPTSEG